MRRRDRNVAFEVLILACVAAFVSCGRDEQPLNVLIIGLDTLRQDHLGCYGYDRTTSPCIDELASRGVLCENAISQSPWTLPSFASVFTSLYPTQHGATSRQSRMGTEFPTLAEILRGRGFATGAVVNAPLLKPIYGVDRGFDFYMPPTGDRVADGTTEDALQWIGAHTDRPFFIFVHYFDPHLPYEPPPPYDTLFAAPYVGSIGSKFGLRGTAIDRQSNFKRMRDLPPDDWGQIVALYDGEIAFADKAIGRLLKGVGELGLMERTLIIFLSDHGEEFLDHGGFEHGHTLYNELIQVPLIFSLPGKLDGGRRISRQVRLVDIAPTILDFLDVDIPPNFEGTSLKPLLVAEKGEVGDRSGCLLPSRFAYSESLLYYRLYEKKCLMAYPWKLIYDMTNRVSLLFNLAEDPDEQSDMAQSVSEPVSQLEQILFRHLIDISDTWFVEIADDGGSHTFDIGISIELPDEPTRFTFAKVVGTDGEIHDLSYLSSAEIGRSSLRIRRFVPAGVVRLAFKPEDQASPVMFNISIDGNPATDRTFIGASLVGPHEMPFNHSATEGGEVTTGQPTGRPAPPYVLVWLEQGKYSASQPIELDSQTEKELRAVGYIQ